MRNVAGKHLTCNDIQMFWGSRRHYDDGQVSPEHAGSLRACARRLSKHPLTLMTHFWDGQRTLGTAYLANLTAMLDRRADATLQPTADAMWDAFYVYGAEDRWQDPVPVPVIWGYPIMVTRDQLVRAVDALVAK